MALSFWGFVYTTVMSESARFAVNDHSSHITHTHKCVVSIHKACYFWGCQHSCKTVYDHANQLGCSVTFSTPSICQGLESLAMQQLDINLRYNSGQPLRTNHSKPEMRSWMARTESILGQCQSLLASVDWEFLLAQAP